MGALTSAGFSHHCEDSGHRRTGTNLRDGGQNITRLHFTYTSNKSKRPLGNRYTLCTWTDSSAGWEGGTNSPLHLIRGESLPELINTQPLLWTHDRLTLVCVRYWKSKLWVATGKRRWQPITSVCTPAAWIRPPEWGIWQTPGRWQSEWILTKNRNMKPRERTAPDLVFVTKGNLLGRGGESQHCSMNINTLSLSPLFFFTDTNLSVSSNVFLSNPSHLFLCSPEVFISISPLLYRRRLLSTIQRFLFGVYTHQAGCCWGRRGGHCCLQVESLRILLAVETPLREGLDEEEERRSVLALLPSVPFTQTVLARAGHWSSCPWSRSSSTTCPKRHSQQAQNKSIAVPNKCRLDRCSIE